MKKFTAIFLVALLFLSHFHEAYAVTRMRAAILSEAQAETETKTQAEAETETTFEVDYLGLAKACIGTLMEVIPPDFCWKTNSGREAPSECPAGYQKVSGDCVEPCPAGHRPSSDLKLCYKDCFQGDRDNNDNTCTMLGYVYSKYVYKPKVLNFWTGGRLCKSHQYLSVINCYNDCEKVGLVNCGPLACASTSAGCKSAIASMTLDVLFGILKGAITFATLGTATLAMTGLRAGVALLSNTKAGEEIKKVFNNLKAKLSDSKVVTYITDKALAAASKIGVLYIKDAIDKMKEEYTKAFCKPIFEWALGKKMSEPPSNAEIFSKSLDLFDVKSVQKDCGKQSEGTAADCSKSVLSTLANIDPTGILTVAAAFVQPQCKDI